MNDDKKYILATDEKLKKHEDICLNCGRCCGSEDGDPCIFLKKHSNGKYFCDTYETRLGPKKTIHGYSFNCVPIEKAIRESNSVPMSCPYRQNQ